MQKNYFAIIPANVRYDEDLSPNAKLLYGEITALTNEKGFCWASNQYFADLYKIHKKSISRLITQLEEKGYIRTEVITEHKTIVERRIYIIDCSNVPIHKNEEGYGQNCGDPIHKNEDTPIHKIEEVKIFNNTDINNTLNSTVNNNGQTEKKKRKPSLPTSQLEEEFETLWKLYPRKEKKDAAKTSYIKARKDKTTYEEVENGLYRFIEHIQSEGTEKQFIPHGSTWFNQKRWNDEYTSIGYDKKPRSISEYLQQKYGGESQFEPSRNRKIINGDARDVFSTNEIY